MDFACGSLVSRVSVVLVTFIIPYKFLDDHDASTTSAPTNVLSVGDNAPELGLDRFLQGESVTEFEEGKVYVLEFWATWCGPCLDAVPHLNELSKRYESVTFLGVNVFEYQPHMAGPVAQDCMEYAAATDRLPEDGDAKQGFMATHWLQAANRTAIPETFIIDRNGRIAWIGHPLEMDEPLAKIVANKWDLEAAAAADQASQSETP